MILLFTYCLLFLSGFYLLGALMLFLIKTQPTKAYASLFAKILTGLSVFVIIYSLIRTHGQSINLLFIPITGALIYQLRKGTKPNLTASLVDYVKLSPRLIIETLLITIAFFSLNAFLLQAAHFNFPVPPHVDYLNYANMADYMNKTGIESRYLDYIYTSTAHPMPYHYFEIWLTAGITTLTGQLTIYVQQLIAHVILFLLICLGMISIIEHFKPVTVLDTLFAVTFLFFGSRISFHDPNNFWVKTYNNFLVNGIGYPKSTPMFIFLMAFLLLAINKKYRSSIYVLLMMPVASIAAFPSVIITVILLSLAGIRKHKTLLPLLLSIFIIAFVVWFYFPGTGHDAKINQYHIAARASSGLFSLHAIKIIIDYISKSFLEILLVYFPFSLLILVWYKKWFHIRQVKFILLVTALISLSGIAVWSILSTTIDSNQLFSMIALPLLNIVVFAGFLFIIYQIKKKILKYVLYIFFGLWCMHNVKNTYLFLHLPKINFVPAYSDTYLNKVAQTIRPLKNKTGVLLAGRKYFVNTFSTMLTYYAYRDYLGYVAKGINIIPLNTLSDIPLSKDSVIARQEKDFIHDYVFSRYMEKQKKKHQFVSVVQSRVDFIRQYHVHYMFVIYDAPVDSLIQAMVKEEIRDPKSGEKLLLFK